MKDIEKVEKIEKILSTAAPSLIVLLSWFITEMASYPYDDFPTFIIAAYILSILLLVACVKKNFGSLKLLPIGFVLPSFLLLVYEFFDGGWLQYLVTFILAVTYSFPFLIITAIIIVMTKKVKEKAYIPLLSIAALILAVPCLLIAINWFG